MEIHHFDDYPISPWKNGGGVTREIMRTDDADGNFIWRMSLADVGQSGPFSTFDGYQRTITLLDGAGFMLNFDDGTSKTLDTRHQPYDFDGGAPLQCDLIDGLSRDFNLMVRHDAASVTWQVRDLSQPLELASEASVTHLIFVLAGEVVVGNVSGKSQTLQPWDSARVERPERPRMVRFSEAPATLFSCSVKMRS